MLQLLYYLLATLEDCHGERRREAGKKVMVTLPSVMPCERMRPWVALMRCPASFRLSIASSRTVSSSAMTKVYGRAGLPDLHRLRESRGRGSRASGSGAVPPLR